MSFFIKGKQQNGVKRAKYAATKIKKRKLTEKPTKSKKVKKQDEEITSSEDENILDDKVDEYSSSEDDQETAQEKKLRLAKIYLEEIEKEEKARRDDKEVDEAVLSKRLKEDYLKETGKLRLQVADKYTKIDENIGILKCREQHKTITCICISSDDKYIFVGSKDGVVVKYSLSDYKRIGVIPFIKNSQDEIVGHNSEIHSLAVSSDSKYLAVGTKCSNVYIWDSNTFKFIKKFQGHKKAITGLCFKRDSYTLYSCSKDRTAKVWSLDEMAYVETLFGHQDVISSIDALYRDRLVSCGGRDLRMWKIPEETQLIFNGHLGNIDNVKLINEDTFVSGGDDGQICVWSMMRKKPLCIINDAHGVDANTKQPFWISAVTALHNTDLIASGSQDGFVRLWKMENNFKNHKLIKKIPVEGFVNCLQFTADSKRLIISVSREHKYGRWTTIKSAKNCLLVVKFLLD